MTDVLEQLAAYPAIFTVVAATLKAWPEHEAYCSKRFAGDDPASISSCDEFAELALRVMGDELPRFVADYRWTCEEFLKEELFFHREGRYRLSSFADAYREVYAKPEYMARYVHGILVSQVLWDPHARAFEAFRTRFLPSLPPHSSYLEVGPGHGFFLYFASRERTIDHLEAWDVSPSSIMETKDALQRLSVKRAVEIVEQDVLAAPPRYSEFDAAVISEVLEHLERPADALKSLHLALKPHGRIFINVPVNSPAPDHIYLWRSPEELHAWIADQGFDIQETYEFPQTGCSLERATKLNLSINCVVIARKSA